MNSQIYFFILIKLITSNSKPLNELADTIIKECNKRYNTPTLRQFNNHFNKLNK